MKERFHKSLFPDSKHGKVFKLCDLPRAYRPIAKRNARDTMEIRIGQVFPVSHELEWITRWYLGSGIKPISPELCKVFEYPMKVRQRGRPHEN